VTSTRTPARDPVDQKATICAALTEGRSLRSICEDEDMPARGTVFRWLIEDEDFRAAYSLAREAQAEAYADEIVDIADQALDRDSAAAAKVRTDARKWVASKLLPKKYGEATLLKHAGADGDGPVAIVVSSEDAGL
jgi:hypothetical protein